MRLHTGKILSKSASECAEHVESLHAVQRTGHAGVLVHLHIVPITFTTFWKPQLRWRLCLGNNAYHVQVYIKRLSVAGIRQRRCLGKAAREKRLCGTGGQGGLAVK